MKREEIIAYEIYVKSFNDSNGDGIGDLKGITEKINYLSDLGINYIWLTPIYLSPQNDNGYDVSDYLKINPDYGTMKDFEELIRVANEHGIEIMLDMVLNHTSTEHEWFQRALKGEKKYQDYYIFKESASEPTNWESKFGGNAWEYVENLNKWYLHLFDVTQADTNWENEELKKELYEIVNFWKSKGVKGFRFDVINLISKPEVYENDNSGDGRRFYTDGPKIHELLKELNNKTFGDSKDFATVGEMSSTTLDNCIKYTNPNSQELMMTFNFHHLKIDYKDGDKWKLKSPDLNELKNLYSEWTTGMSKGDGWMANFLSNHDQPRHLSRFGSETDRYSSATSLATTYILLRGTPFIYYGEEIGMLNAGYKDMSDFNDVESHNAYRILTEQGISHDEAFNIILNRSRDNGRIPMQWDETDNSGFSEGNPWLRVSDQYKDINLSMDLQSDESIFNWYKDIIKLRKDTAAFKYGQISFIETPDGVIGYKRTFGDEEWTVVSNWTDREINLSLEGLNSSVDKFSNKESIDSESLLPFQVIVWRN